MTMKNRKHTVAALMGGLVCLLLVSCRKDEMVAPVGAPTAEVTEKTLSSDAFVPVNDVDLIPTPAALVGRWELKSLHGRYFRVTDAEQPWISIRNAEQEGSDVGRLTGFGGCNRITGSVLQDNTRVDFTNLGRTRKYCPETRALEEQFFAMLAATNRFEDNGDQLRFFAGSAEVAVFQRVQNAPVARVDQ